MSMINRIALRSARPAMGMAFRPAPIGLRYLSAPADPKQRPIPSLMHYQVTTYYLRLVFWLLQPLLPSMVFPMDYLLYTMKPFCLSLLQVSQLWSPNSLLLYTLNGPMVKSKSQRYIESI